MKKFNRITALILSMSMTAGMTLQSVSASAGEDPPKPSQTTAKRLSAKGSASSSCDEGT